MTTMTDKEFYENSQAAVRQRLSDAGVTLSKDEQSAVDFSILGFIARKEYKECRRWIETAKVETRAEKRAEKRRLTENRGYGDGGIVFASRQQAAQG